jgi:hypothetical protein
LRSCAIQSAADAVLQQQQQMMNVPKAVSSNFSGSFFYYYYFLSSRTSLSIYIKGDNPKLYSRPQLFPISHSNRFFVKRENFVALQNSMPGGACATELNKRGPIFQFFCVFLFKKKKKKEEE